MKIDVFTHVQPEGYREGVWKFFLTILLSRASKSLQVVFPAAWGLPSFRA